MCSDQQARSTAREGKETPIDKNVRSDGREEKQSRGCGGGHRGKSDSRGVKRRVRSEWRREWKGEEAKDIYRRADKAWCLFPRGAPRLGFFKSTSSLNLLSFARSLPPSLPPPPPPPRSSLSQIELLSACRPEGRMSLRHLASPLIAFMKLEMSCGPPVLWRGRGAVLFAQYTNKCCYFF